MPPDRETTGPGRAVLLVHGIYDTGACFGTLAEALAEAGLRPHALDLDGGTGEVGLDALAEQVDAAAADLPAPFDLVGFSMGGLVSRYYVQRLGGHRRVRRLVTLAAPHRGSVWAYLRRGAGFAQMRPGSAFLRDLDEDVERLEAVDVATVWTPFDAMIVPATSCRLPVGEEVRLPVLAHPLLLTDDRAVEEVVRLLQA